MVHGSERVKIFGNIHSGIHAVLVVYIVNLFPILLNGQFLVPETDSQVFTHLVSQ
jgi:hypothetical protein